MSELLKLITDTTTTPEWVIVAKHTAPPNTAAVIVDGEEARRAHVVPTQAVRAQSLADVLLQHWPADSAFPPPTTHTWGAPQVQLPPILLLRLGRPGCRVVYQAAEQVQLGTLSFPHGKDGSVEVATRAGIEQALERARSGVGDVEARVFREVEERSKLRQVDVGADTPGDYDAVLARVEGLLGDKEPTCEVCKLYWPTRRQLPGGRLKLFTHLCTAGHVALELGLTTEEFRALADKRQHGVPLDGARPPVALVERDALRDLAEGLHPMLVFVQDAADVSEQLARLGAVLAAAEGAVELLEAIEHPARSIATTTLKDTQQAIAKIANA